MKKFSSISAILFMLLLVTSVNGAATEKTKEKKPSIADLKVDKFIVYESKLSDVLNAYKHARITKIAQKSNSVSWVCIQDKDEYLVFFSNDMYPDNKIMGALLTTVLPNEIDLKSCTKASLSSPTLFGLNLKMSKSDVLKLKGNPEIHKDSEMTYLFSENSIHESKNYKFSVGIHIKFLGSKTIGLQIASVKFEEK